MTLHKLSLLPALLLGLLVGCEKEPSAVEPSAPEATASDAIAVFSAPAETVIARVGEVEITVGDFRRHFNYETSVYRLTMMNARHKPKNPEKRLAGFERSRLSGVLPNLVHIALLERYLASDCGGCSVADEERIVTQAARRLGAKIGKKGATLTEVAAEIGVEQDYLRKQFLIPSREAKVRLVFDPASTNVTEQEIDAALARLDAYTERAAASNRTTRATCERTLAAVLKPGADFAAVAKTCGADNPAEATEWGWFNREDFGMMAKNCPAFRRWAFAAKVGDIGGPFDIDDGLSIVKVVARQEGTAVESMASKQVEEVQLVRINFAMAEENPEPKTREHCRSSLLEWKAHDAQSRLFTKLFHETEIEYPNGTRLDFTK